MAQAAWRRRDPVLGLTQPDTGLTRPDTRLTVSVDLTSIKAGTSGGLVLSGALTLLLLPIAALAVLGRAEARPRSIRA